MLLLLLPACCPCRRIETSAADSVRVETRVHREVVRDTVMIPLPRESERVVVRDTVSRLETSLALSEARINSDGTLSHSLANRTVRLPAAVECETVLRDSVVWRDRIVTRTVETERQLSGWQRFRLRWFWILAVVTALLLRSRIAALMRIFGERRGV